MRKKTKLILYCCILLFLLLAGGFYFGLAKYYADGFSYGTWVNGVYCTGKSIEEVNEELVDGFTETQIEVSFGNGETEQIALEAIMYKLDYKEPLRILMEVQNPNLWIVNLQKGKKNAVVPTIEFDAELLSEQIEGLKAVKELKKNADRTVKIEKTERGYLLKDEKKHVLDIALLKEKITDCLQNGEYQVLIGEECYMDIPLTKEENELYVLWEKIEKFQDCKIQYDMGDVLVPVDAGVVCEWITLTENGEFYLDEDGALVLDEEKLEAFVEELVEEYDTLGGTRSFQATRGETVTVEGGTYGNKLDKKAELAYLKEAFLEGKEEIHVPAYKQEAYVRGKDDIGTTYIEIDMTEQMMYYYVDGEIYVETPVVTGNMVRNMSTPAGTCFVYGKQKNRILRGANYASFVNFWVPVRGNIGIHDAPWRSEYGDEIYKTNGSHGCINTPYAEMEKIYEHVEIGTPVVMFY